MSSTKTSTSRHKVLDVIFLSGVSIAALLILFWLPLGLFVAMGYTGLERTIAANNLYTAVSKYPMILALPIIYAILFQKRRGLLAVIVAIMWCANIAVVIVLGACMINVYGTDRDVGDWYELEDDGQLIDAIIENDVNHVDAHIQAGKRVIFYGERGVNPMYVAVHLDRWAIAKTLSDAGVDIRVRAPGRYFDALSRLFRSSQGQDNESRIEFLRMLINTGIKPEIKVNGHSLLETAVAYGDMSALHAMLPYTTILNDDKNSAKQLALYAIDHRSWTCGEVFLTFLDMRDLPEVIAAAEAQKDLVFGDSPQSSPRDLFISKLYKMRGY